MYIEDGTGSGYKTKVDEEHLLHVLSVVNTSEHHANHVHSRSYSVPFVVTTTDTDKCIFYLTNTDDDDLIITTINYYTSAASNLYLEVGNTGTRNSATAITPVNRNIGSGNSASCTAEYGTDLAGGDATLSSESEIDRIVCSSSMIETGRKSWDGNLILRKNSSITIWSSAAATITVTLSIYFHHSASS